MYSLGGLKRFLERFHLILGATATFLGLSMLFLKHNYVVHQRDLIYWREVLLNAIENRFIFVVLVLTMIFFHLVLLLVRERVNLGMHSGLFKIISQYHQRKFADFIVRRLLWQLELAMLRMPVEFTEDLINEADLHERLQLVHDSARGAVDIFRRDAAALLVNKMVLSSGESPFFILQEEAIELVNAGYSKIRLNVTIDVLRELIYSHDKSKSFD